MKKFECNGCANHCVLTTNYNRCSVNCNLEYEDWHEVKEETVTNCNQLPKLTSEVFDRPDCPAWANYAAVDANGKGFYFRSEPKKSENAWQLPPDCKLAHINKFDSSDWGNSLIRRPPKEELPDWVKVDNIGWHDEIGYFKVIDVDDIEKKVHIQHMISQIEEHFSFNTVCTEAKHARPRPFNDKEMQDLVGKVLKHSTGNYLVTAFDNRWNQVKIESTWREREELKEFWTQLDGKPCYKLEHQNDKGEWVK
jgi:hypothetical protein